MKMLDGLLKNLLKNAEMQVDNWLLSNNYQQFLVKRELMLGEVSKGLLRSQGKKYDLISYQLCYTFFEDFSDGFGSRPNDVFLDFVLWVETVSPMLDWQNVKKVKITRFVGSGADYLQDVDYTEIFYPKQNFEVSYQQQMITDFLTQLKGFFEFRALDKRM